MKAGDEVMVKSGSMRGALGELVGRSVFMYDCWVVMIYGSRKLFILGAEALELR